MSKVDLSTMNYFNKSRKFLFTRPWYSFRG